MALRITKRSCFSAASRDRFTEFSYRPTAMPIRIKTIVMTTSSSSKEKPAPRLRSLGDVRKNEMEGNFMNLYQSEYFVLSVAVPVDVEYTSKTLCPPQLVASGSSPTARKPQSALPVIG